MKTQNTDIGDTDKVGMPSVPSPQHSRSRARRWLGGIGAGIVVALLVGLSAVVFAQLSSHRSNQGKQTSVTNTWEQVLKGYTVTSIEAAPSNSNVLYACVLAGPVYQPRSNQANTTYTILRSTDARKHWQDVGSKEQFGASCELAINPANSNELYAISATTTTGSTHVDALKHSMDAGQTWQTLIPTISIQSNERPVTYWHVIHLSFERNRLFALQQLQQPFVPQGKQEAMPAFGFTSRLVTSSDGGHTWIEVKSPTNSIWWGVSDYVVDPSNINTIYALMGGSVPPIVPAPDQSQATPVIPRIALNMQLYKTTDGGATWKLLLQNVPFGSQVALARSKPQIVYVGGMLNSLLPESRQPNSQNSTARIGVFQLQVSSDGGANWRNVTTPPEVFALQNWFVSEDGQLYLAPIRYNGQPTNGTTTNGSSGKISPATTVVVPPTIVPVATSQSIWRYDPGTDQWSEATKTPTFGALVGVTPGSAGAILWFMGENNQTLYRYIV